jgi:hypothetical protein
MARPRLPETPHVPPTPEEEEAGLGVSCVDCDGGLVWSAAFADRRLGRCVNHVRELYRQEYGKRKLGGRLFLQHGLDAEESAQMMRSQRGACGICERAFSTTVKRHADHDQGSGHFRGFLCGACIVALGFMDSDPERCENAAAYVRRHAGRIGVLPPRQLPAVPSIPGLAILDEKGYPRSLLEIVWKRTSEGMVPTLDVEKTKASALRWLQGKSVSTFLLTKIEGAATQDELVPLLVAAAANNNTRGI